MPLIYCPDCGNQVSDIAPNCPQCGRPIAVSTLKQVVASRKGGQHEAIGFLLIVFGLLATFALGSDSGIVGSVIGSIGALMLIVGFIVFLVGRFK